MYPDLDVLQVKTINNCTCSNNLNQVSLDDDTNTDVNVKCMAKLPRNFFCMLIFN